MVKTNKNARRTGAAVYGAGALAAGGAGYGAYRMTKKSSFFEEDGFDKEAAKMRLGKRISGHLYNTGVGLSNKLWGKGPKKGAKLNWRQNLARKMVKTNKNARRTGAAVYGAGALAAGGAGYGIYRGTRKNK
jgi:hypothetical protein